MTTLLESPITASVPKYMVDALGFSKSTKLQTVCTAILLIFFIKGVVHHSFGFAGINPGGHSELWHGFNMFMCEVAIFAIFSQRELGWFWLLALFVCEIPIELTGTFRSYGSDLFAGQLVEVVIDTICLAWWLPPGRGTLVSHWFFESRKCEIAISKPGDPGGLRLGAK